LLCTVICLVGSVPIQNEANCGIPAIKPDTSSNIVGGKDAIPYSWPWQVALFKNGNYQTCGGSLISNQWVMLAAHCIEDQNPSIYKVKLGVFNKTQNDEPGEIVSAISTIVPHPKHKFTGIEPYDIGLLKLEKPVEFTDHISPICLPSGKDPEPGTDSILTGWGRIKGPFGDDSESLKQVTVPVALPDKCHAANEKYDNEHMICFGLEKGGKGGCNGDSGGPAVYQKPGDNGRWTQIGITSWGSWYCSQPTGGNPYSMFARVSTYLDFVKEHVKDLPV